MVLKLTLHLSGPGRGSIASAGGSGAIAFAVARPATEGRNAGLPAFDIEDRLVAITEAATARMLVPSTPGGVVHNSSERPTHASQCVLTALARRARCLPARRNADELAARTRGRLPLGPHAGSASSNDSGNAPRSTEARSRTPWARRSLGYVESGNTTAALI